MNEHAESKTPISSKFIGIMTYIYIEKIILEIALLWGALSDESKRQVYTIEKFLFTLVPNLANGYLQKYYYGCCCLPYTITR